MVSILKEGGTKLFQFCTLKFKIPFWYVDSSKYAFRFMSFLLSESVYCIKLNRSGGYVKMQNNSNNNTSPLHSSFSLRSQSISQPVI